MATLVNIRESNKGLEITATKEGREYLMNHKERNYTDLWIDLIEDYECNGSYKFIHPEKIGALTDAPIIGLNVEYDEESNIEENEDSKYWWLADYMVMDELKLLRMGRKIIFNEA